MKNYTFGLQKGEKRPLSKLNILRNVPACASVGFVLVFIGLFYYNGYLAFNKEIRSTNYISPLGHKEKNSQHEDVQESKTEYSSNSFLLKYFFKRNHRQLGPPTEEKTNKVKHTDKANDHYQFRNHSTQRGNKYVVAIHYDNNLNRENNITTLLNFNKRERNGFKSIRNTPGTKVGGLDLEFDSSISKQKTSTKSSLYNSEISLLTSFKEMNVKNTTSMVYLSKVDTANNVKKHVSTNQSYKQSDNLSHGVKFSLYSHKDSYNETSHLILFDSKDDTLSKSQINMAYKNEKEGRTKYNVVSFLDLQISFILGSSSKNKSVRPHYKNYLTQEVNIPTKLRTKRDTRKPIIANTHTRKSRRYTQKEITNKRQKIKEEGRIQRNYHENGNGKHRENSNSKELINFSKVSSRKFNKQPLKNKFYRINRIILYKDNTKIIVPNEYKGTRSGGKNYSCRNDPGKIKKRGHYFEEVKVKTKKGIEFWLLGLGFVNEKKKTHEIFGARNDPKGECEELVEDVVVRDGEEPGGVVRRDDEEPAEGVVQREDEASAEVEEPREDEKQGEGECVDQYDITCEGEFCDCINLSKTIKTPGKGELSGKGETTKEGEVSGNDDTTEEGEVSRKGEATEEGEVSRKGEITEEGEVSGKGEITEESELSGEIEELGKAEEPGEDDTIQEVEGPGEGVPTQQVEVPGDGETTQQVEVPGKGHTTAEGEAPREGQTTHEGELPGEGKCVDHYDITCEGENCDIYLGEKVYTL